MTPSADLADMAATELLGCYRRRELSPVEVTKAALARIEAHDHEVNAFCLVDAERALGQAAESERRWERGEPAGLLDGVPASVKDLLLTAGWPTLRGSTLVAANQDWTEDAPSVARLREHGAVLVGKTTTPELGWKGVTDSARHGVTRNPWDTRRTPGGSSGGAAVAVSLGMGALAVGTDGGGSVRIPAAFTGVFGLKPTYGRVPLFPASPYGTLAHIGPLTRTAADAALMMDVLSRPDSRDWSALPPPDASHLVGLDRGVRGLRVAYSPTLGYVDVHPEVATRVRAAVDVLEGLGAVVEEVDPGFGDPVDAFHVLWFSGAAKSVEQFPEDSWARLDPGLREACAQGREFSASEYLDATAVRMRLGALMGAFHETYDVLVTPTVPLPAFDCGIEVPEGSRSPRWTSWTPFTYPFNLTQQPAASVACGFTGDGLPVGLQVVGPRFADRRVLAVCAAYERAVPPRHPARVEAGPEATLRTFGGRVTPGSSS